MDVAASEFWKADINKYDLGIDPKPHPNLFYYKVF